MGRIIETGDILASRNTTRAGTPATAATKSAATKSARAATGRTGGRAAAKSAGGHNGSAPPPQPAPSHVLNLNARRDTRYREAAQARAARRGAKVSDCEFLPIYLGYDEHGNDRVVATLGPELALDVFSPLLDIDVDLSQIIALIVSAAEDQEQRGGIAKLEALLGILVSAPNLPRDLITAAGRIGVNLLGADGFAAYMAEHPSKGDHADMIAGVAEWYGLDLGELLGSYTSSSGDGGTSTPTSAPITTVSTQRGSGDSPGSPGSSDSPL